MYRSVVLSLICLIGSLLPMQAQETTAPTMSHKEAQKSIEQFLSLTAIWMLELEWTHAYQNKTPKPEEFRDVMLAAGLERCPVDFQEAWAKQIAKPGRNYAAPVLRAYDIKLSDIRKKLQKELFKINPRINPPIPLYDEEETIPKMDPTRYGRPADILDALAKLRAKTLGLSPEELKTYHDAIHVAMLQFMLAYIETIVCMDSAGIPESDVASMFESINITKCPKDFQKAWKQDLPNLKKGVFHSSTIAPMCKRYGVDHNAVLLYVKNKMKEWDVQMPTPDQQNQFRQDMKDLGKNIMGGRLNTSTKQKQK